MPLLEIRGLRARFGGLLAIDDISFGAKARSVTTIIGPNGAGKTTLFNCITGFYRPTEGTITLNYAGRAWPLHGMRADRIARQAKVSRTFQNIRLFPAMTVLENLLVSAQGLSLHGLARDMLAVFGFDGAARRAAVDGAREWLVVVGLEGREEQRANTLSYGDQRRLEIARALCANPVLVCFDEPAAGLNPREKEQLAGLLSTVRSRGVAMLLVEHDMTLVMDISDHLIVLDQGRKIADGPPETVRKEPAVIAAYLGVVEDE